MDQSAPSFREIPHGTAAYVQTVALRDEILRRPLGLAFNPEELAAEKDSFHLTCWQGDELVACLVLKPLSQEQIRLRQMAVRREFQGRGLGTGLVRYSEAFAWARGYRTMVLHARATAVGFYARLDYHVQGERFLEVTIPHYAMEKTLAETGEEPNRSWG